MKKRLIAFIGSLTIGMTVGGAAIATMAACTSEVQTVIQDVTGFYYGESDGKECSVSLDGTSYEFVLVYGGEEKKGTYVFDGTNLVLTFEDTTVVNATFTQKDNAFQLKLSYAGVLFDMAVVERYDVKFKDGDSVIDTVKVVSGKKVNEPATPVKSGYAFIGWYDSASFGALYDFESGAITEPKEIYARFIKIDNTKDVFKVKFSAGEGVDVPEDMQTVNGKIYNLPVVSKSGEKFAGWWVSDYNDGKKLTYKYTDQELKENTTLFAVWESAAPLVSVFKNKVEWTAKGVNNTYTLTIKLPDGTKHTPPALGTTSYTYDFSNPGDYEVTVALGDYSTTVYFKGNGLAAVSFFEVDGDVLKFKAVENAQTYLVTVDCGDKQHEHVDIDTEGATEFNFAKCKMQKGGIKFVVKAVAEGYAASVSEEYYVERNLDSLTGLKVDEASDKVVWNSVVNADYYVVTVEQGDNSETFKVVSGSEGFSLNGYKGEIKISVYPEAYKYNASQPLSVNYTKSRLDAPENFKVVGYKVSWTAVDTATGYVLKIGDTEVPVSGTEYTLTDEQLKGGSVNISVKAKGATQSADSIFGKEITISKEMTAPVYKNGELSWNTVVTASSYEVKVNDGDAVLVDDSNSVQVVLTKKGANEISVRSVNTDGTYSAWVSTTVMAFEIKLDALNGGKKNSVFYADGDYVELPAPIKSGFVFRGWYDLEGGASGGGQKFESGYLNGDMQLFAFWVSQKITVNFAVGFDVEISEKSKEIYFGEEYSLPVPRLNDSRYAFGGWYTEPNGKGERLCDEFGDGLSVWNKAAETTLYPSWLEVYRFIELSDGTYSVSKGVQTSLSQVTELRIPSKYNGKMVSTVEGAAFQSCNNLLTIYIPNSIKLVAMGIDGGNNAGSAFQGCTKLQEVIIYEVEGYTGEKPYFTHEGVLYYNRQTTSDVELVYFPYAKQGDYVIPDGVTRLPINSLKNCKISNITIPASVRNIDDKAFYSCTNLLEVMFAPPSEGENVQSLVFGEIPFEKCSKLEKVTFPARLAKLSHEVVTDGVATQVDNDFASLFTSCSKLREVYIDGGVGDVYSSTDDGIILSADKTTIIYCPAARVGDYTVATGVSVIGARAFKGCTKLTSITIPAYVTEIQSDAFSGCYGVTQVNFLGTERDGNLAIRERAFYRLTNTNFKSLVLPANLTELGQHAFGYCTNLKTVTINCGRTAEELDLSEGAFIRTREDDYTATVTTVNIGAQMPVFDVKSVFGGAKSALKTINVSAENQNLSSVDGVLFNKDITEILFYPAARTDTQYKIPDKVITVRASAFSDISALESITIGKNVEEIATRAFARCVNLANLNFEGGRTQNLAIGSEAFVGCSALEEVTFPEMTYSVESGAFSDCIKLHTVNLPASFASWGEGDVASVFAGCNIFANINIAEGNENFSSFDGVLCGVEGGVAVSVLYSPILNSGDEQHTVTFPSTITEVGASAFAGNANIQKIVFTDSNKTVTIGEMAFSYCAALTEVVLPAGLQVVESMLFFNCPELLKVNIPYTVQTIKKASFAYCSALNELKFDLTPNGVEAVGLAIENATAGDSKMPDPPKPNKKDTRLNQGAFVKCTALNVVVFPERMTSVGDYSFARSGLTEARFPSTITRVGKNAFYYCEALNTAVFAESMSNVVFDNNAFSHCDLNTKSETQTEDGATVVTGLVLPTKLTTLGTNALEYNKNITAISLPSSLTAIGNYAFRNNTLLATVTLPAGLSTIGTHAFQYCEALQSITIPDSVTSVGKDAFEYCYALETVTLSKALQKIDSYTFQKCNSLASIVIPENVTLIGNNAFANCTVLSSVEFTNKTVTVEGTDTSVSLLTEIGNSAFMNCEGLQSISIPASVTKLGSSAFSGCSELAEITFQTKEVTVIDGKDDSGADITHKEQQSDLKVILGNAFAGTAITEFTFPVSANLQGFTTIGNNLFTGCTLLTTVNLSRSVTDLSPLTFDGCKSIQAFTIASDNVNIANSSELLPQVKMLFNLDGTVIKHVYELASDTPGEYTLPEGITGIGPHVFKNQNNIRKLTLPSTLTSIGDYAFQNCRMLEEVNFAVGAEGTATQGVTSLTTIGKYAFDNCLSLKKVTVGSDTESVLPSTLTTLDSYAFYHSGLQSITVPASITTFGTCIFEQCYALETVYHNNTAAMTQSMYGYCSNLKNVYVVGGLRGFGNYVFQYSNIETMKFLGENGEYVGNDGEVTFPEGMTSIPTNAFKNSGFKKVVVPSTVTSIAANAFFGNYNLKEVVFAENSAVNLAKSAFEYCQKLDTLTNSEAIKTVGDRGFAGCSSFVNVSLPECESIGKYAFSGCVSLREISLLKCQTIGDYAFIGASAPSGTSNTLLSCGNLETVRLATDESVSVAIGNYVFGTMNASASYGSDGYEEALAKFNKETICGKLANINFDRVVSIGKQAFSESPNLTEISLPVCTLIGEKAFSGNSKLTKVTLSTDSNIKVTLEGSVFSINNGKLPCLNLREINLENVESIGRSCFEGCTALLGSPYKVGDKTYYRIDLSSCASLKASAFEECTAITEVTLNPDVNFIENFGYEFAYCESLVKVNGAIKSLGKKFTFYKCYALEEIDLSQVTEVPYATFEYDSKLKNIDLSSCVTVGEFAFDRCDGIVSVILGDKIENIQKCGFQLCTSLENINLGKVKSIGNSAFYKCYALSGTVDLSSATSLDAYMFYYCENIQEVLFNYTIKEIPSYSFYGCDKLAVVDIPGAVTSIGSGAFFSTALSGVLDLSSVDNVGADAFAVTDIQKVIIGDYLREIGNDAFGQCANLVEFEVSADNQFLTVEGGALYEKALENGKKTLLCYPAGKTGEIEITSDIIIAPYAFAGCYGITKLTVPANLTEISEYAFWQFRAEIEFAIPETVTDIKAGAFQGTLMQTVELPQGLTKIGASAFRNTALTTVTVPEGVVSIGDYAFANCKSLTSITLPSTLKTIGASAFEGCSQLAEITLNDGLSTIGKSAFKNCTSLTQVNIPDNVENVDDYAFEGCAALNSATFGANVGRLGVSAFYNCQKLESVTFGDGFGLIGASAFGYKYEYTVSYNATTGVATSETYKKLDGEENSCIKLKNINFLGTVEAIDQYAFAYTGVTQATLPVGAKLNRYVFAYCPNLTSVVINGDNLNWVKLYNGKEDTISNSYIFAYNPSLSQVEIKEGVTSMGTAYFYKSGNGDMQVSWPTTLTTVPNNTFYGNGISSIILPEGVTKIGDYAFYGGYKKYSNIASVKLPSTLTNIGNYAFSRSKIVSIDLPALETLGYSIFEESELLESVTLVEGMTKIGEKMFFGCSKLAQITIPSTITTWGGSTVGAFEKTGITSVTLPEGLTSVGAYAFRGLKITEINLPSTITKLDNGAFANCDLIESVTIPANITTFSSGVFKGCTSLTTVEFAEGFTRISSGMFDGCTSIKTLIIPTTVTYCATAFSGWTKDQTIIINTTDGWETASVNNTNGWITGWLMKCGATIIVRTPTSETGEAPEQEAE